MYGSVASLYRAFGTQDSEYAREPHIEDLVVFEGGIDPNHPRYGPFCIESFVQAHPSEVAESLVNIHSRADRQFYF